MVDLAPGPASPHKGLIGHRAGDTNGRKRATEEAEKARFIVIGLIRQGKSPKEAMGEVDRTVKTFYNWCTNSPKFAKAAKAAQEAYFRSQKRDEMTFTQIIEEFEPIRRENYKSWAEYQVAFRKAYFNHDTFDHQWEILEAWDASPPGGISLILLPPEAGKTTLLKDTVIGDFCADPNVRRAVISETLPFASKVMNHIQRRLQWDETGNVPPLIAHFGPFTPNSNDRTKKWNSTEFTLLASDHDEQDPSFCCVGAGGNIRGARWDRVDLDDIQSLRTQMKTQWLMEIFRGDIITRPGRLGRIRITGSRVARGDFYDELERLDILDQIVVIPALDLTKPVGHQSYFPRQEDAEGLPITGEDGNQLGWSDDDLAQRRQKVGEDQWSRVYMMKPQSDFSSLLTEQDIISATDPTRRPGQTPPNSVAILAGLDPALAGHAAFTYCGYDADHLYVMSLTDLFKPTTNQNLYREIDNGCRRFRPNWWVIENNTHQSGYLTDDAFLALKEQWKFNSIGHHTGNQKSDPQLGVPAMMDAITRGEIRFPAIGDDDVAFATLYDQLLAWRPDVPTRRLVQDQVMSLWFCYMLWRKLREQVDYDTSAWNRGGLRSITMYPDVQVNLPENEIHAQQRTPMTYEQHWESLQVASG